MRRPGALLLAAIASGAVWVPHGHAADVEYYTGTGNAGAGAVDYAQATCPFPGKPTGGGSFSSGAWGQSYLTALELDDADIRETFQAWSAAASEVSLTATVACVKGPAALGLRYRTKTRGLGADRKKALVARCPAGFKVVGGEVTHDAAGAGVLIQASRPADRNEAWKGELLNTTASPQDMYVTAACASGGLAKKLTYRKQSKQAPESKQTLATSDCPQGAEAVGGGVSVDKAIANVNSSGISSTGSGSATFLDAGAKDTRFTNYVICVE